MSSYLGQFTDENADLVVDALEDAGIAWSAKRSGTFARVVFAGDWGVRLFVERAEDLDRARSITAGIAPDGLAPGRSG